MRIISNQIKSYNIVISNWHRFNCLPTIEPDDNIITRNSHSSIYNNMPSSYELLIFNHSNQNIISFQYGGEKKIERCYKISKKIERKEKKNLYYAATIIHPFGHREPTRKIGSSIIHNRSLVRSHKSIKYTKFYIVPIILGDDDEKPTNKIFGDKYTWVVASYCQQFLESPTTTLYIWGTVSGQLLYLNYGRITYWKNVDNYYIGKILSKDLHYKSKNVLRSPHEKWEFFKKSGLI